jgi:hypothetical protein
VVGPCDRWRIHRTGTGGAIAATIKSHRGKVLTEDVIEDLFTALRDIPKKLKWKL